MSSEITSHPDHTDHESEIDYDKALMWMINNKVNSISMDDIIKRCSISDRIVDSEGNNVLTKLCIIGDWATVRSRIKDGVVNLSHANNNNDTVLSLASRSSKTDIVLDILNSGEECGLGLQDRIGLTPLMHWCIRSVSKVCIKMLETPERCNLDARDSDGKTAFILACDSITCSDKIIEELVYNHDKFDINAVGTDDHCGIQNIMNRDDSYNKIGSVVSGMTRAEKKVNLKYFSITDILKKINIVKNMNTVMAYLQRYPETDISFVNYEDDTLLMRACRNRKCYPLVEQLLKYPHRCMLGQKNKTGHDALRISMRQGNPNIASLLLKYYVEMYPAVLSDDSAITLLMDSIMYCRITFTMELFQHINKRALGMADSRGNTALMIACRELMGREVALKILNYPGYCGLHKTNDRGETALMIAMNKRRYDIVRKILQTNVDCSIDARLESNLTAMSILRNYILKECKRRDGKDINEYDGDLTDIIVNMVNRCDLRALLADGHQDLVMRYYSEGTHLMNRADLLPNPRELINKLQMMERCTMMKEIVKTVSDCVMCTEQCKTHTLFDSCKHVVCVCEECTKFMKDRCPICMKESDRTTGLYIV